MSVLIKGMEMPKSCRYCACYHRKVDSGYYDYEVCQASGTVFNDGYASVTGHKDKIDPFEQRLDNCPLVPVPPHDVADDLRQIPTIDAVPVKHGEWLPYEFCTDGTWDKCSVCGVAHRTRDKYTGFMDRKEHVFQEQLNYCPNCGAKMEGERKDDV